MRPREAVYPIGPSIAYIQLTQGFWSCVDVEDAPNLSKLNWLAMTSKGQQYAARKFFIEGKWVAVRMQRYLFGMNGPIIDHINGHPLDNRRGNLRPVSCSQNAMNRSVQRKSKTGFKGVYESYKGASGVSYVAQIRVEKKLLFLGYYRTKEAASAAYMEAAQHHFGQYARA